MVSSSKQVSRLQLAFAPCKFLLLRYFTYGVSNIVGGSPLISTAVAQIPVQLDTIHVYRAYMQNMRTPALLTDSTVTITLNNFNEIVTHFGHLASLQMTL
jgi:hypothetical protein